MNSLVCTKTCIPPNMNWDTFCAEKDIHHPREAWMLLAVYAFRYETAEYAQNIAEEEKGVVLFLWMLEEEKRHAVHIVRSFSDDLHYTTDVNQRIGIAGQFIDTLHGDTARRALWFCWNCGAEASPLVTLRTCGSCRLASYCSSRCQKQDWTVHKRSCAS